MEKVQVMNIQKKKVADLELESSVFGAPIRNSLFYEVVKRSLAARRRGTHATKTRHFVSGLTKSFKQRSMIGPCIRKDLTDRSFLAQNLSGPSRGLLIAA